MADLLGGFSILLQPINIFILIFGTILGFTGGAIPGISGTMLVVLLVPLTYTIEATSALLSLITVYCSAVFGGSISAILFRTPGAPESVATTLDGYPMTLKGQSALALGVSVSCSAIGGIIGSIFLITLTPQLAKVALQFGPVEYFGLCVMALSVISSLGEENQLKSLVASLIGLVLMTIGIDPMTGSERFTFGSRLLMSGIDFIPILIGLFAVSEGFRRFEQDASGVKKDIGKINTTFPDLKLFKKLSPLIARSSLLGTVIGILPGIGATTASMVSYSEAVRTSKTPEKYGTGIPEGVAAPETANNAAACGAIIPLIALGIPGSATTAVMLGAFILHGIVPGPLMFIDNRPLIYALFVGCLIANILILLIAKPFIKGFPQIIKIPYNILGPIILVLCLVGGFAIRNSILDVWMILVFGIIGYTFEKFDIPTAPIVIGAVLGSLTEQSFRRALVMSNSGAAIFFQRPVSAILIVVGLISFAYPLYRSYKKKKNLNKMSV